MDSLPKPALIIAVAAGLFLVFLGARLVIDGAQREAVNPQLAYDELNAALVEAKLLPLGTDDELLMAYTSLMRPNQINAPNGAIGGSSELWLGTVFHGAVENGRIKALYISPQGWRELRPGALREALRKLADIPLEKQSGTIYSKPKGGALPILNPNFHFICRVGSDSFRYTPRFDGNRCTSVLLRAEE